MHGGKRNGAGRPRGAISLNRRALIEAAEAGGEMPVAYMLKVMRDENSPDLRRDAMARAAAAILYPRASIPQEDGDARDSSPARDAEIKEPASDAQ
jgi:hypothetical protein